MDAVGRRAGTAVAVVSTLVLVGLALGGWAVARLVEVRADAAAAERALAATEAGTEEAADDAATQQALLAAADLRLGATRRALDAADTALDAAAADHAAVVAELEATRLHLDELEAAVSGAGTEVVVNAALVGQLGTCLDGLSELVNQLAVGDRSGAVRTASNIGPSCAAVGAALT